jgi:hypothetical protein
MEFFAIICGIPALTTDAQLHEGFFHYVVGFAPDT